MDPAAVITSIAAGIATVIGSVLTWRKAATESRRGVAENMQDQIDHLRQELDEERSSRRVLEDYVHDLRNHIATEQKPPPPPWPERLLSRR